jgi:Xaa-Pro aminopeptidase
VIDAGAKLGGYCSECMRTFATGPASRQLARAYEVCLDAQLRALEAARAGAPLRTVHELTQEIIVDEVGVYLAGRGGVRIEDRVIVTGDAPEALTPFPKELVTLD